MVKNSKQRNLMILGICLVLFGALLYYEPNKTIKSEHDEQEELHPITSQEDITIITPENRTYTGPMSGYYPATYGFENDEIDATPQEWIDQCQTYSYAKVIDGIGGHNKVLEFYSGSEAESMISLSNYFVPQVNGMIEWWWRKSSTQSSAGVFLLYGSTATDLIQIPIDNQNYPNTIRYTDETGTSIDTGYPYADDKWIHMRIEFNCTSDSWSLWIDNFKYVDNVAFKLNRVADYVNRTLFWSLDGAHPTLFYVDAVGYSWDQNYNIGDNMKEGLLLSYENTTNLDWMGYSLDGMANKTIIGNTTIPLPADGSHTIQVFGNDSMGLTHESELREFNVNHITINTPESTTYTGPMSGYYPATFGFEEEEDGVSNPRSFDNIIHVNCEAQIIPEIGGHKKVLRAYDNNISGSAVIRQRFNDAGFQNQTHGTVEYYFRVTSTAYNTAIRINWGYGIDDVAIKMRLNSGQWQAENISYYQIPNIPDPISNTWYHIKIHFRCEGASSYQGLGENEFELIINDISSGQLPFTTNSSEISMIQPIFTAWGSYNGNYAFLDAIGYSWDPNYNIGDNRKEGLLLEFENTTNLDWIGYSLDGQANRTILGNTTIPLPADGSHSIQVFGNDSSGVIYKSEIREFNVNHITINTPENITYTGPMSGYYPATYGFENDFNNSKPEQWTLVEGGTNIQVISQLDGHKKVIETRRTTTIRCRLTNVFPNVNEGFVELWFRTNNTQCVSDIMVREDDTNRLGLFTKNNQFYIYNGSAQPISDTPILNNTWYHIRIEFNISSVWHFYLNGEKKSGSGFTYFGNPTAMSNFFISTNSVSNYNSYFDAIGYSWDPNYNIGDNMNEGLLLSYQNTTELDWKGYSLDGQRNVTISGNTTFPMPVNGYHSIQVFGNDSLGDLFLSDLRYFTVNLPINISLLTPENDTYYDFGTGELWLSYQSSQPLEWTGYSLDGNENVTISGNTTIPMPSNGLHSIQLYGNDSLGNLFLSDLRFFTINIPFTLDIITPESKIYAGPMSGYYPATHGFETDEIGTVGTEISWINSGGTNEQKASIVDIVDGHRNVMKLEDDIFAESIEVKHDLSRTYGTWEFWLRTTNVIEDTQVILEGSTFEFIVFGIENGQWYREYESLNQPISNLPIPQENTWYRITIHFRCNGESTPWQGLSENRWKVEINGASSGELIPTRIESSIQQLKFKTEQGTQAQTYSVYIDAIGYDWDSGYTIGDNKYEGLLIALLCNSSLDWIGYSLDGQNNITIFGNTAIPLPACGYHTIQVHGKDSLDNVYSSQLRSFKIEALPISIDNLDPSRNWAYSTSTYYWCSGSGTQGDPYVIANLIINGEGMSNCISIDNSNDYFLIEGCEVYNSGAGKKEAGTKLYNVTNGFLTNNNCSFNNGNGICLVDSNYNNISGNTINDNGNGGIALYNSDSNIISDNRDTINNNGVYGIYLYDSDKNHILNNVIGLNLYAVYLNRSNYNRVWDNDFEGNMFDIYQEGTCIGNALQGITSGSPYPIELVIVITIILLTILGFISVGAILIKKDIISTNFQFPKIRRTSISPEKEEIRQELEDSVEKEKISEPEVKESLIEPESDTKPAAIMPPKKAPKKAPKKTKPTKLEEKGLTQEEVEELKKTESEVDVEEKALTCIVHKGPIDGPIYVCPKCKTFYCTRCATALKEKGEKCWSCESDIKVSIEDSILPKEEQKIRKLELSLNTLRKSVQNLDESFYNGAITKEEYSEMREPIMNKIANLLEEIEKLKE